MSLDPPLTEPQQAEIGRLRAKADYGKVYVKAVPNTAATVRVDYFFGGRRQSRLILADGYTTQAFSEARPSRR